MMYQPSRQALLDAYRQGLSVSDQINSTAYSSVYATARLNKCADNAGV